MLDFLRARKRSWVILFFVTIIVLVFVLWGVGSYVNEPIGGPVVVVNGEAIGQREFEHNFRRLLDLYRDLFKNRLTPELIQSLGLRTLLLEELIEKKLLLQEARKLGLLVTDEELMRDITRLPGFQEGGGFSKTRYQQALRIRRLSPAQFEAERRADLMIQKIYDVVRDSIQVSERELQERFRFEQERVNFYFIRFRAKDYLSSVTVSDDEVQREYQSRKESLREPFRVKVEYLTYPFSRFTEGVEVTKDEVEDFYLRNRESRYHESQAVKLRQILIRVPETADIKGKKNARLKAEQVLRELGAGADFATLAEKYSDDPSSEEGGDLGWFTEQELPRLLAPAALRLKKGEVSEVLEGPAGFHVLKAEDTRTGKTRELREVRQEITDELKRDKARLKAGEAADADREAALSGMSFSVLAERRRLKVNETPFFALGEKVEVVGGFEEFNEAAFSLSGDEVSRPVEGKDEFYLLRVKERKESFIPPLESIRSRLLEDLQERNAMEMALEKAKSALTQLKEGKDILRLGKEIGRKVEETGWFRRSSVEIPKIGGLREASPGEIILSQFDPVADRVYTQEGSVFLLAFQGNRAADMELFEKEKAGLQERSLVEKREKAFRRFLQGLKARAEIEVQASVLEAG